VSLYLVSGAAGFIASHVAEQLLDAGHQVLGLDDLNDAYDVRMKRHRLERLQGREGFRFACVDVADRQALAAAPLGAEPCAGIVNLAARAGVRASVENPWIYVEANVRGTLNLLELARERRIPKFLLASTSSLYGASNPLPYREDAETHPLSPYAATKKAAEALCEVYHGLHHIDVSVVRYFTVYGPAGRPDMSVFRFIQWIREGRPLHLYGDGEQSRDFTFVADIARGTVAALAPVGFEIINLGGDEPHSVRELISLMEERLGRKAEIRHEPRHPADAQATWADVSKAGRLLGWRPQVALAEGIDRAVRWYEAQRAWAREIATA